MKFQDLSPDCQICKNASKLVGGVENDNGWHCTIGIEWPTAERKCRSQDPHIEEDPPVILHDGQTTLYNWDCLDVMRWLPDKSVDCIIADLPYGYTELSWDSEIEMSALWGQYRRLIKDSGSIILFGNQPFTSKLVMAALDIFKYSLVWHKSRITKQHQAQFRPLPTHEDILVFGKYGCSHNSKVLPVFNSMAIDKVKKCKDTTKRAFRPGRTVKNVEYLSSGTNYPRSILAYASESNVFHPTQKPVALLCYLVETYTNQGDTVIDNTMGSGSCGVACRRTGRSFIGVELDETYFQTAKRRIESTPYTPKLF